MNSASTTQAIAANIGVKSSKNLHVLMWVLTLLFVASLLLCILLVFIPYSLFYAYHDYVYQTTHNFGLDPLNWFPFSLGDFGEFLYELAKYVWGFAAYAAIPLVVAQLVLLFRNRTDLTKAEKVLHPSLLIVTIALSTFMLTIGQTIIYWLLD